MQCAVCFQYTHQCDLELRKIRHERIDLRWWLPLLSSVSNQRHRACPHSRSRVAGKDLQYIQHVPAPTGLI